MKPDDRSLDITVVGLGQAGGNIATEFFRRGHTALALNTAKTDLSALDPGGAYPAMPAERRLYIGLDGYDGAGADPSYGADCVAAHEDLIRSAVQAEAQGADAIILAAGLGGGTGSAVNELVNVLKNIDVPLIGMFTLPTEDESALAKVNTVRAINDLVDAPLAAWVFIDNSRVSSLHQDVSVFEYYPHINSTLVAPLDELNRLNERSDLTVIRSFDGEDFRKLLLSGGVLNYGVVELPNITVDEIAGAVIDCLEASDLMPSGFDPGSVSYIGLVVEAPESVMANTPMSAFEAIDRRLKEETNGAAVYRGIYQTREDRTTLRLIAATRSLPHRIRELLASARQEGLILQDKLQEQLPTLDLGDISGLELFRPEAKNRASERPRRNSGRRTAASIDDIRLDSVRGPKRNPPPPRPRASKLEAPTAEEATASEPPSAVINRSTRPIDDSEKTKDEGKKPRRRTRPIKGGGKKKKRRPTPPPPPLSEADDEDQLVVGGRTAEAAALDAIASSVLLQEERVLPDEETSEIDLEAEMAKAKKRTRPPPPPPVAEGEGPEPEEYDKLVAGFLHASDSDEREAIAQRLEDDSLSSDTAIRYFAVDAMSKLGRDTFGSALLAASEDENDAVRSIALEALRRTT